MTPVDDQPHGRRPHRPTKAETEQRIAQIHTLLVSQVPRKGILQFASEKTAWNLTDRAVDSLIAKATRLIETSAAFNRQAELGLSIAQLKDLYAKSVRIQDFKGALQARRELNELLALYAPKRMEVTGADCEPQQFVVILPAPALSREAWSEQCKREQQELARTRAAQQLESPSPPTATTPA